MIMLKYFFIIFIALLGNKMAFAEGKLYFYIPQFWLEETNVKNGGGRVRSFIPNESKKQMLIIEEKTLHAPSKMKSFSSSSGECQNIPFKSTSGMKNEMIMFETCVEEHGVILTALKTIESNEALFSVSYRISYDVGPSDIEVEAKVLELDRLLSMAHWCQTHKSNACMQSRRKIIKAHISNNMKSTASTLNPEII